MSRARADDRRRSIDVAVTGSRDTDRRGPETIANQFAAFLGPFVGSGARFVLGGAAGIDTLALAWLAGAGARCIVAVPVAVADQPVSAQEAIQAAIEAAAIERVVELAHPDGIGLPGWDARNRWLVDHSAAVVGFPASVEPDASGTWDTLRYAARRGRATLVIPPDWTG
jgi:predicted Rossmann fold nucleotide-binding protein DprA/Smf involved in DNA uptake